MTIAEALRAFIRRFIWDGDRHSQLRPTERPDEAGEIISIESRHRGTRTVNHVFIAANPDPEFLEAHRQGFGEAFLAAAKLGDRRAIARLRPIQKYVAQITDPRTGANALHYIASGGARPALRALLKNGEWDYLVRDREGRLASEIADAYGNDPAMARLLSLKEARQAKAQGLPPPRRRPRD